MNDESSGAGGDNADSWDGNSDPRESESADLTALIVEGFTPVPPHPRVWRRIDDQLDSPNKRAGRHRKHRGFAIAAVIILIVGIASAFGFSTSGPGLQPPAPEVAIRHVADPDTGDVVLTLHTHADGSTTAEPARALPTLDEGLTYQLWSVVGTEVVSVGVLGRSIDAAQLRLEGDPSVLALTIEVAGGVAVSSATPVAVWTAAA